MAERGPETSDVPVRAIVFWTGLGALAAGLALAVLFLIFERGDPGRDPAAVWAERPAGGPRLERDPAGVRSRLLERDRALLQDGPLSIEDAMAEVVDAGWRSGDPAPSPAARAARDNPQLRPRAGQPHAPGLAEDAADAAANGAEDTP